MNQELIDLAIKRGRLLERIDSERRLLRQQLQPVADVMRTTDRALAAVRRVGAFVRQHPEVVTGVVVVVVVMKPNRVWRWSKRGFFVWRTWRLVRREASAFGLSPSAGGSPGQ